MGFLIQRIEIRAGICQIIDDLIADNARRYHDRRIVFALNFFNDICYRFKLFLVILRIFSHSQVNQIDAGFDQGFRRSQNLLFVLSVSLYIVGIPVVTEIAIVPAIRSKVNKTVSKDFVSLYFLSNLSGCAE